MGFSSIFKTTGNIDSTEGLPHPFEEVLGETISWFEYYLQKDKGIRGIRGIAYNSNK